MPPYLWEKGHVEPKLKRIPGTKPEMKQLLEDRCPDQDFSFQCKEELKQSIKNLRGKKHPKDPMVGASSLSRQGLEERLAEHDVQLPTGHYVKGDLLLKLRAHWAEQCGLACVAEDDATSCSQCKTESEWGVVANSDELLDAKEEVLICERNLRKAQLRLKLVQEGSQQFEHALN